jgi:hypothetical protein
MCCWVAKSSDGEMPGGVTPKIVLHDLGRILDNLSAEVGVVVIELHAQHQSLVEQPVVMIGQLERSGLAAVQVADVLTRAICELGTPDAKGAVVRERQPHQADTGEWHPWAAASRSRSRQLRSHGSPSDSPTRNLRSDSFSYLEWYWSRDSSL